jgi:hypothetical protein
MLPRTKADWLIPTGLIILCIVPTLGGVVRLAGIASGGPVTEDNARFLAAPSPAVIHIIVSLLFGVFGALQFSPGFRTRHLAWHRISGRLMVICGLISGYSGLWLTLTYPHVKGDGPWLYGIRLVVGVAMVTSIFLAFFAIRQRKIATHKAWMIRGYAIGMGAGTQVITHLPWIALVGVPTGITRDLLMAAGWGINIIIAEWIIRRNESGLRQAAMT